MKIYSNKFTQLLTAVKQKRLQAILFYGPNKGLILDLFRQLKLSINAEVRSINYADIAPSNLEILLYSTNLFTSKEIIKLTNPPSSLDSQVKKILQQDFPNFLVIIADELAPSSSLRKFFEEEEKLVIVPCYLEAEHNLYNLVTQKIQLANKTITTEAVQYLTTNFGTDRQLLYNELEKLLCFAYDQKDINLLTVQQPAQGYYEVNLDLLVLFCLSGISKEYYKELDKIQANDIPPILIIRSLIKYYNLLYHSLIMLQDGLSIEQVIKALNPAIFFRYINLFTKILKTNLKLEKALKALETLYKIEKQIKRSLLSNNTILLSQIFSSLQ